jgi:hypothetical protein
VRKTRRLLRRNRPIYPFEFPSYLLPPVACEVVFDASLRPANEVSKHLT